MKRRTIALCVLAAAFATHFATAHLGTPMRPWLHLTEAAR